MNSTLREQTIIEAFASTDGLWSDDASALSTARVLIKLSTDDKAVLAALCEIAMITLRQQQELTARSLDVEQLQCALDSRIRLEQAKGVLFARGMDSLDEAFRTMREYARGHNLRLHDVATSVVRGDLRPTAAGRLA